MSHSTLSINGSNNFLGNLKQGLKKKPISWNKYQSEITQQKTTILDYIIGPTLGVLTGCLFFFSMLVKMILQGIDLISITCH